MPAFIPKVGDPNIWGGGGGGGGGGVIHLVDTTHSTRDTKGRVERKGGGGETTKVLNSEMRNNETAKQRKCESMKQ